MSLLTIYAIFLFFLQLFDHIASCLASFIKERSLTDELLPLGFTFSFPCAQEGLTKARLAMWTKGFKCSGVEGEDVVELLQAAIARRGVSGGAGAVVRSWS